MSKCDSLKACCWYLLIHHCEGQSRCAPLIKHTVEVLFPSPESFLELCLTFYFINKNFNICLQSINVLILHTYEHILTRWCTTICFQWLAAGADLHILTSMPSSWASLAGTFSPFFKSEHVQLSTSVCVCAQTCACDATARLNPLFEFMASLTLRQWNSIYVNA